MRSNATAKTGQSTEGKGVKSKGLWIASACYTTFCCCGELSLMCVPCPYVLGPICLVRAAPAYVQLARCRPAYGARLPPYDDDSASDSDGTSQTVGGHVPSSLYAHWTSPTMERWAARRFFWSFALCGGSTLLYPITRVPPT